MNKFAEPPKEDTYDAELIAKSELPKAWIRAYTEVHNPKSDEITQAAIATDKRVVMIGKSPIFGTKTYFAIQYFN